MAQDFDPALLEEPEWQEALRAAESPLPRRPRERRESPSAIAGAANGSYEEYLTSGGLREPMRSPIVVDLDLSGHQDEDLGSARTSFMNRRSTSNPATQARPMRLPSAIHDEDDEIAIISPPRSSSYLSGPSRPSTFIPFYAQSSTPQRAPAAMNTSPPEVIDLDHQMALELQRQLDGNVDDIILEIDDNDTGFERVAPLSSASHIPPAASSITRHTAPAGPARGTFGVVTRHGSAGAAPPPSGISRNHTDGSFNYNGRNNSNTRRPNRELPPVSRSNTVPVSPAHQRSQHVSGYDSSLRSPEAPLYAYESRRTATQGRRGNAPRRNAQWIVDEPDFLELDFIPIPDDDDDEMRLRSGVSTRQAAAAVPRHIGPRYLPRGVIDQAISSRNNFGRLSQVDRDRELAAALQGGYDFDLPIPRRARGGRGRGRMGEFEVDTNDYEAMLRLSEQAPPVKRGASSAAISSLPVVKASNDDCTICQGTAETTMVALPCLHTFHRECILPHLKMNRFCPNCRHELE